MIEDLWYKDAVIYCLDVETFMDGNGDGVGDFRGLTSRLPYLAGLGVTCIWLLPFYESPNRDNGYDISDYYSVDPRFGDLGDFVEFSHRAKAYGIRIIVDLVVNHTSNEHPWFQKARSSPDSPYRDYYIWSKEEPKDAREGMVFPGVQETTWTWDDEAGEFYHHRFYEFQPDLNVGNPRVRGEITKIMGFWLELGVAGFRVDAVPFIIDDKNVGFSEQQGWEFLNQLRDFLSWRSGSGVLLAEANVTMDEVTKYFDEGKRMQLVFNFMANQNLFAAFVSADVSGLAEVLRSAPKLEPAAQWAEFLRNHDELDLGRLSDRERKKVFDALGPEPGMQLYGRGLRRRLAPMLGGDMRRIHFAYAVMLGLPGTPVFWYGEEIGMGENLELEDRHAVRTPMQWSTEGRAGFTRASHIFREPPRGEYAPERVNVALQRCEPSSLLNRIERLIRMRKDCPEIGRGTYEVLKTRERSVLALRYDFNGSTLVVAYNFADSPLAVKLRLADDDSSEAVEVFSGTKLHLEDKRELELELEPYGFQWLRLGAQDAALAYDNARPSKAGKTGKASK